MSQSNDKNGEAIAGLIGVGLAVGAALFAIVFLLNALAFLTSASGYWIGKIGEWPVRLFTAIGFGNISTPKSFAIAQALGWFTFFGLLGTLAAVLFANSLLPAETPRTAFDESRVSRSSLLFIVPCIALLLLFIYIIWKY